jgi:hypothetical protein
MSIFLIRAGITTDVDRAGIHESRQVIYFGVTELSLRLLFGARRN